ncbi:LuxR family transcriptional regulator [Sphingomonas koreensis]|nr:LuxR family transcriptional regulator [Sphingomonas koreensis]
MKQIRDLSSRQVECLRWVADGVTSSKAIAERTGLSPSSIDNYLSRAAVELGVQGREAAAKRLLELQQAADQSSVSVSVSRFSRLARPLDVGVHGVVTGLRWLLSVPPIGGRRHDLNRTEIFLSILKVAAVSFTVFIVIVLVGVGLLWLLR